MPSVSPVTEIRDRTRDLLAILSGLALTAAFPDVDAGWLAWIALVPLLVALSGVGPKRAFRLGFLAGLSHFLTLTYWLVHTMGTYGGLPVFVSLPLLGLLAAYLALYPAACAAGLARWAPSPVATAALLPPLWVAMEYLRATLLTGFPWELLGYTQYARPTLIQIADLTGPYGVSALVAAGNGASFLLLAWAIGRRGPVPAVSGRAAALAVGVGLGLLAATIGYGRIRLQWTDDRIADAPTLRTAVVQGNIDQKIKWDPAFRDATVEKYLRLTRAAPDGPELVVWPETATPFYFGHDYEMTRIVKDGVRRTGAWLLTGSPAFERAGETLRFHNSAYLLAPTGKRKGRYDKVHLVPYGEYVPLKRFFPFIGKIVEHVGDFKPGTRGDTLKADRGRIGVLICYEIIFPELARAAAKKGAVLLTNLTNDAWYGRTSAPYQHFSMAVFRAAETKRALARAANTGISGFIDPAGRVGATTPLFVSAVRTAELPLLTARTVYTRIGDLFAIVCLTGVAGFGLVREIGRRRRKHRLKDT